MSNALHKNSDTDWAGNYDCGNEAIGGLAARVASPNQQRKVTWLVCPWGIFIIPMRRPSPYRWHWRHNIYNDIDLMMSRLISWCHPNCLRALTMIVWLYSLRWHWPHDVNADLMTSPKHGWLNFYEVICLEHNTDHVTMNIHLGFSVKAVNCLAPFWHWAIYNLLWPFLLMNCELLSNFQLLWGGGLLKLHMLIFP